MASSASLAASGCALSSTICPSPTEHFASTYLIAHGAAKVFVAWGLLREKLWAFPTGLVIFGLLILYQLYHFVIHQSAVLAVLIALDVGICYLIWREYGYRRGAAEPLIPGLH